MTQLSRRAFRSLVFLLLFVSLYEVPSIAQNAAPKIRLQVQPSFTNAARGDTGNVQFTALSPDDKLLLAIGRTPGIWEVATGREVRRFEGSGAAVSGAFSPDGQFALTGGSDKTARLWELKTGREIRRFQDSGGFSPTVNAVAFSPDGRHILTDGGDGARLWETSTGRLLRRIVVAPVPPSEAYLRDMAKSLGTDLATARATLSPTKIPILSMVFSDNGQQALLGAADAPRLVDLGTGYQIQTLAVDQRGPTKSVALSGDGRWALTEMGDGETRLWDVAAGRQIRSFPQQFGIIAFSSDSLKVIQIFIGASGPGKQRLVTDLVTDRELQGSGERLQRSSSSGFPSTQFSQDGRLFISPSGLTNAATGQPVESKQEMAAAFPPLMFSGDGRWLLTAGTKIAFDQHTYRIWDTSTGQPSGDSPGLRPPLGGIVLSSDGRRVLTADNTVTVWDVDSRQPVRSFPLEQSYVGSIMAFSSDGRRILTSNHAVNANGTVQVWDVDAGKTISQFGNSSEVLQPLAVSSDGRLAVTSGSTGIARLWETTTGKELRRLEAERRLYPNAPAVSAPVAASAMTFSPDDRFLFAADALSGSVLVWETTTGKVVRSFRTSQFASGTPRPGSGNSQIQTLICSPRAQWLMTVDTRGTAVIFNNASGMEVRQYDGYVSSAGVRAAPSFSADDRFVLVAGKDDAARLFEVATGVQAATMIQSQSGGWAVVAPDGRFDTNLFGRPLPLHWLDEDDPLRALPLELFMRQYYTPRLLASILTGQKLPPLPSINGLNRAQPEVAIKSIESRSGDPFLVDVTVEIKEVTKSGKKSGAKDVRLFRDGRLVSFKSGGVSFNASGAAEIMFEGVRLPQNNRRAVEFSAYAFNADQVKSETALRDFNLPNANVVKKGRAFVLAIGVNDTPSVPALRLRFAANDARGVAETMREHLKRQSRFESVHASLLISELGKPGEATKVMIRQKLAEWARIVRPEDFVLISFSGHGYADGREKFFIFPSDITGNGKALPDGAISNDELTDWLRPIDAEEMVLILDACHSAASVESGEFKAGPMGNSGLGQLAYDKRMRILAASQIADVALENDQLQKGLLSFALVDEGLKERRADWEPQDGTIRMNEWLTFGVRAVPEVFERARSGKLRAAVPTGRKIEIQRPALFDFAYRASDDFVVSRGQIR